MKELKKAGQCAGNFAQRNGDKKKCVGKMRLSIAVVTGHARTIAWTVSGKRQIIKAMQPLVKRKVGVRRV